MVKQDQIKEVIKKYAELEQASIIENIDQYSWFFDHNIDDYGLVVHNFIRNYKTTNTHSIMNFSGDYQSSEAEFIVSQLGVKQTAELILKHSFVSQDYDSYREHWNDIFSELWNEYESQIDIDKDSEHYKLFKGTKHDNGIYGISFLVYVDLGRVRLKLDTESFEKDLWQQHGIDVNTLIDLPEVKGA